MKFAHLADCHLGAWRIPSLQQLNLDSFKKAVDISIKEGVEFILISGDLFDSAYPPIEILKETFSIFKKIKETKIPVFIIAGSHDYSASGKTFLDVLEHAGFCKNVYNPEIKGDPNSEDYEIILNPIIHKNVAIYGYPGKKSGLEVSELKKIKFNETPGLYKIFMLHTTLTFAKGTLPIDSVDEDKLPKCDYYAIGHLHIDNPKGNFIYAGPTFPNNFEELEELHHGQFYMVDTELNKFEKVPLPIKQVEIFHLQITDALTATEKIISEFENKNLEDKIVLLRLHGELERGKPSNIDFQKIEKYLEQKNTLAFLRNTSKLKSKEGEQAEIKIESSDMEKVEIQIVEEQSKKDPSKFNDFILPLIHTLSLEKQEDEKSNVYLERLYSEVRRTLKIK
ncbi:MAG: DNA repair exonuclease [Nanoarchaeota archaeon]|nr:DNA repair exonuclease [Nanoarchaeota archaeon]